MASSNVIKFNFLGLIIIIAMCAPLSSMANLTCCKVKPALDACKCYATKGGDSVSQDCCYEALNLKNNIITCHQDLIDACHCIQDAARNLPNINATAFSTIPENCGIRLPFNFNVDMNCDSLK